MKCTGCGIGEHSAVLVLTSGGYRCGECMKKAKSAVDYSESTGRDRCGNCVHFEVEALRHCELVKGIIEPEMWCKLYKRARAKKSA